jgi:hypothetical protein
MRIAWLVVSLMWIVACGGDDDAAGGDDAAIDAAIDAPTGGACGTAGTGTVTGSVGGATISPVVRANQVTIAGAGVGIVLDEVAGACGEPASTGEHLVLGFCDAPTVRTYTVVGEQAFGCPGMDAFGLMEQNGGEDFGESLSGTITIASVDATCVSGSFDISFMPASGPGTPESLSGTFNAVICP